MTLDDLKSHLARGEDSRRQFKQDVTNADALAAEMAAFANSEGYVQDKTLNAQMNSWVFSVTFRTALRRKSSP